MRKEGRENGKKIAVLKKKTDQTSHTPRYPNIFAARLRLEREVPQGEYRRHYVLAAGAGQLVDDDEGDEEFPRAY